MENYIIATRSFWRRTGVADLRNYVSSPLSGSKKGSERGRDADTIHHHECVLYVYYVVVLYTNFYGYVSVRGRTYIFIPFFITEFYDLV